MTLPHERTAAVLNTLSFLYDLLDPRLTPRVPKDIRIRARELLKHYPHYHDMTSPTFGKPSPNFRP